MVQADVTMAIRFGTGLSPRFTGPISAEGLLADLGGDDTMRAAYPVRSMASTLDRGHKYRALGDLRRKGQATDEEEARFQVYLGQLRAERLNSLRTTLARGLDAPIGFRERLAAFWANHFTAVGRAHLTRALVSTYVDEAIRPNLSGQFSEMLKAAVLHPVMLMYLDQQKSAGPNSSYAKLRKQRGLNENLAREVLELHTLGVGSGYTQTDVRQLAELLTGVTGSPHQGFRFRTNWAEPGTEFLLGKSYGSGVPALADIHDALDDLSVHPDTARHVATKLAVHFIADDPPADLVEILEQRYNDTDGNLTALYVSLLEHPSARGPLTKARQPYDFMLASFRALGVRGDTIMALTPQQVRQDLMFGLRAMGQDWQQANGPDGWPEPASHWFTPQGLAARINWALGLREFTPVDLPDPRKLVVTALGSRASDRLTVAASAAETRADGVALILASPEFQRR